MDRTIVAAIAAMCSSVPAPGAVYHVAVNGSDAAAGTRAAPWASVQHAADRAAPGDTVVVHGGIYSLTRRLRFARSGSPGAWITFEAARGETPVLDAAAIRPASISEASGSGAVEIHGPSFLRLVGLTVRGSYGFGISVRGPSRSIDIARCRVDRTFGPAIGAWNCSDVRVIGCEVTGANSQEMRLFGDRRRECPHEAISIAGVDRFEVAWNHVHHCEKEGIDVKEVSRRGVVHHNWVHDMPRQGLYADAWFGLLEDVEFASNVVHDCEWGFVVSVEGRSSELRNVRAHHNVLYRNRASGVFFGLWGSDGLRSGIRIENNTLHANGRPVHWAGPTGNIDLRSQSARDVVVARNICSSGGAFEIATGHESPSRLEALSIRIEDNLLGAVKDETGGPPGYGRPYVMQGRGAVVEDPRFWSPATGDFRPRPGSSALRGRSYAGAFAGGSRLLPAVRSVFAGWPRVAPSRSGWPASLGGR